jgi:hypothetical protein
LSLDKIVSRLDLIFRKRFFLIVPLALYSVIGFMLLRPKMDYVSQGSYESFNNSMGVVELGNRTDICDVLEKNDGYLLFSGSIKLPSLDRTYGFFQTDDEEDGIFFDFDRNFRVGAAQKNGETVRLESLGEVRLGLNQFIFFISNQAIKLIVNGQLIESNNALIDPSCRVTRVGSGNESIPFEGDITFSISSSTDGATVDTLFSQYLQQLQPSFSYLLSKVSFGLTLLLLVFGNPFKKRESK